MSDFGLVSSARTVTSGQRSFTFAYTYGRAIDNSSGFQNRTSQVPFFNINQFRGPADFNTTQRLTFSGGWDLPFEKAWEKGALTKGWTLLPILTWRTGFPLRIITIVESQGLAGQSSRGFSRLRRSGHLRLLLQCQFVRHQRRVGLCHGAAGIPEVPPPARSKERASQSCVACTGRSWVRRILGELAISRSAASRVTSSITRSFPIQTSTSPIRRADRSSRPLLPESCRSLRGWTSNRRKASKAPSMTKRAACAWQDCCNGSTQKQKGFPKIRKPFKYRMIAWLRGLDLNQRPPGYEPDELPGCSTPR